MLKPVLLLLAAASVQTYLTAHCFYYYTQEGVVYDFKSFRARADDVITADGTKLVFNVCNSVKLPAECANLFNEAYGYSLNAHGHCVKILSADPMVDDVNIVNEDGRQTLVRKSLGSPVSFEFVCKNDQKEPVIEYKAGRVSVTTRDACPKPYRETRAFRIAWKVALGAGLFCGLFVAFLGGYLWNKIIGVFGFVLGGGTAALVLGAFAFSDEAGVPWYGFVVFFLLVVLSGLATAYVFILNALMASVLAGLGFGVAISVGVFHLLGVSSSWIVVSCHLTLGLLGAFLSLYCIKWVLALTTAVSGALLFALSLFSLLDTVKKLPAFLRAGPGAKSVPVAYIVLMAVVALAGVATQFALIARCPAKKSPGSLAHLCS